MKQQSKYMSRKKELIKFLEFQKRSIKNWETYMTFLNNQKKQGKMLQEEFDSCLARVNKYINYSKSEIATLNAELNSIYEKENENTKSILNRFTKLLDMLIKDANHH